ncbi:hypothetical protein VTK73DRAFT_3507 [Phialemonium thermophilum]|uniref:Uncharacterized protein n=1 Tax=Phialemonium thermophilum TaxID=223376 RepID=A0ABR3WZE0_9PEZI
MGLLSFLSKKSAVDRSHSTATAEQLRSPIPPGPLSRGTQAAPNGSGAARKPFRIDSAAQIAHNLESAPAPTVPWFADEDGIRPTTAISARRPTTAWSSHTSKLEKRSPSNWRRPPLSFKRPPDHSAARGLLKLEASALESVVTAPPSIAGHRDGSIRSHASAKFKDILDAQSEFKPLDFKSRVRAAGARDYGEDVADRNIQQNSIDLASLKAREAYARPRDLMPPLDSRRASMTDLSRLHQHEDANTQCPMPEPGSIEMGPRTKSLTSSTYMNQFHKDYSSSRFKAAVPSVRGAYNFLQPSQPDSGVERSQSLSSFGSHDATAGPSAQQTGTTSFNPGTDGQKHSDSGPTKLLHTQKLTHSPIFSQLSPSLLTPRSNIPSRSRTLSGETSSAHGYHMNSENTSSDRKLMVPHVSANNHTVGIKTAILANDRNGAPQARDDGELKPSTPRSTIIDASNPVEEDCAPSPTIKTSASSDAHYGSRHFRPRTGSSPFSLKRLAIEETHDSFMDYGASKPGSGRHWSMSSTTPTASDTSSNSFQRPHSRHTANTSVDLGNGYSVRNSSRTSVTSSTCGSGPRSPVAARLNAFNIDDYISSDEDDPSSPRRPRGEGEEELLFRDRGYGVYGSQLPGLFDALNPSPKKDLGRESPLSRRLRTSVSLPSRDFPAEPLRTPLHDALGVMSPRGPRRYIIDTAAHYDDADADDDDIKGNNTKPRYGEQEYKGLASSLEASPLRRGPLRGARQLSVLNKPSHAPSIYKFYGADEVIEEERDMSKIDIATAVRMRKEAKARKRASLALLGVSTRGGSRHRDQTPSVVRDGGQEKAVQTAQ